MSKLEYITEQKDLIKQQRVDILALNRIKIYNENNEAILFHDLWKNSIVLVIFIRHFSCIACRAHVDEVYKLQDGLAKKNYRVVFIGNGAPFLIKAFKEDMKVPNAEIFTDPKLESFDACGMNRSFSNLINFKSLTSMQALYKKGYRQGSFDSNSGTHSQMGGVVVFKDPGKVLYHFTSKYLGDFNESQEWLKENAA